MVRLKKKWARIKGTVSDCFPNSKQMEYTPPFEYKTLLQNCLEDNAINAILYAGGDGTMNHLLNTLMTIDYDLWKNCFFGGIGLGSSNDFQKPYKTFLNGIPTRLNPMAAKLSDIGSLSLEDSNGKSQNYYFLINASLGVTAEANLLFNRGDAFINLIKPVNTNLAILYTAIKTILKFKNTPLNIQWKGQSHQVLLSNLAILKMPNISGSFKFSQPILTDDGRLGVNVCINMSKPALIKLLYQLSKGQFEPDSKRWSFFTKKISLEAPDMIPVETDGEVHLGQRFEFGLLPQKIKLLGS